MTIVPSKSNRSSPRSPRTSATSSPLRTMRKVKPRPLEDLFPSKLYGMLEKAESLGFADAVSWLPHGRAFLIKDRSLFMSDVVPKFFKSTKFRSFQRQCHLWGFHRVTKGHDFGAWWHESFVRGCPQGLRYIVRTRVKGEEPSAAHVPSIVRTQVKGDPSLFAYPREEVTGRRHGPANFVTDVKSAIVMPSIEVLVQNASGEEEEVSSMSSYGSSEEEENSFSDLCLQPQHARRISISTPPLLLKQEYYEGDLTGNFPILDSHIPVSAGLVNSNCSSDCEEQVEASKQEALEPEDEFSIFIEKMIKFP